MVYLLVKTASTKTVWLDVVGRRLLGGVTRVHGLGESLRHVAPRARLKSITFEVAQPRILLHVLLPGCRGEDWRRLVTLEVVNEESLLGLRREHRAGCID